MLKLVENTGKLMPPVVREDAGTFSVADDDFTRQLLVMNHGAACSAWLAWQFRSSLRRSGLFCARMPANVEMPMWFSIAIGFFKHRAERWHVEEHAREGVRYFTVRWLGFGKFKRKPFVLRSV